MNVHDAGVPVPAGKMSPARWQCRSHCRFLWDHLAEISNRILSRARLIACRVEILSRAMFLIDVPRQLLTRQRRGKRFPMLISKGFSWSNNEIIADEVIERLPGSRYLMTINSWWRNRWRSKRVMTSLVMISRLRLRKRWLHVFTHHYVSAYVQVYVSLLLHAASKAYLLVYAARSFVLQKRVRSTT